MTRWAPGAPAWSRFPQVTADRALGWLPWSAVAASCLTLAVVAVHVMFQRRTDLSQAALSWALAVLVPSLVLANAPRLVTVTGRTDQRGLTAWMLALNVGVLLLVVPAVLAVWQTDWDAITGWRVYPFFNKRWLAALYTVGLITFLVLPVWFERWLTPDRIKGLSPVSRLWIMPVSKPTRSRPREETALWSDSISGSICTRPRFTPVR